MSQELQRVLDYFYHYRPSTTWLQEEGKQIYSIEIQKVSSDFLYNPKQNDLKIKHISRDILNIFDKYNYVRLL